MPVVDTLPQISCVPCTPVVPMNLPVMPPVFNLASLSVTPLPVYYDRNEQIWCEPAPSTVKVLIVTLTQATTGAGIAPTIEYYVYPTGAVYGGNPALLVQCGSADQIDTIETCYQDATGAKFTRVDFVDVSITPPTITGTIWRNQVTGATVGAPAGATPCAEFKSEPILGCAAGVQFTQWVQLNSNGVPTGVVVYTNVAGATVAAPVGWAPGPCSTAVSTVKTGSFAATGPFSDATLPGIAAGGKLLSFVLVNTGTGSLTYTPTDGTAATIAPNGNVAAGIDGANEMLGSFTADATGTSAQVFYTYL